MALGSKAQMLNGGTIIWLRGRGSGSAGSRETDNAVVGVEVARVIQTESWWKRWDACPGLRVTGAAGLWR